jgi:hypothetical protein
VTECQIVRFLQWWFVLMSFKLIFGRVNYVWKAGESSYKNSPSVFCLCCKANLGNW